MVILTLWGFWLHHAKKSHFSSFINRKIQEWEGESLIITELDRRNWKLVEFLWCLVQTWKVFLKTLLTHYILWRVFVFNPCVSALSGGWPPLPHVMKFTLPIGCPGLSTASWEEGCILPPISKHKVISRNLTDEWSGEGVHKRLRSVVKGCRIKRTCYICPE